MTQAIIIYFPSIQYVIISYIHAEIGSVYIRTGSNTFEIDDGSKSIFVDKQK